LASLRKGPNPEPTFGKDLFGKRKKNKFWGRELAKELGESTQKNAQKRTGKETRENRLPGKKSRETL